MTTQVIAATTAAISDKSPRYHANGSGEISFTATGLATTETMTPYVGGGNTWTPLFDSTGTQIKLTATKPQLTLPSGCIYAFDKDATAGAASLEASHNYL